MRGINMNNSMDGFNLGEEDNHINTEILRMGNCALR